MLKIANDLGVLTHKRPDYYASDKCPNSDNFKYMVSICDTENIIYSPVTCPFIREKTYENIINIYKNLDFCLKYDSIVTVEELKEFIYYNNNPLGFESSNIPCSQDFNNTFKLTFGCNLMLRNDIIKYKFSVGKAPYFYKLNKLEGLDIDDNFDFLISQLLYKNKFMTINDINNYLNK